jgi:Cysteine-rich CPCC
VNLEAENLCGRSLRCPCCDFRTLEEHGHYEICDICYWEDCGVRDLDDYSGPNHITLREGRAKYRKYGACDIEMTQFARSPRPFELAEREAWNLTTARLSASPVDSQEKS